MPFVVSSQHIAEEKIPQVTLRPLMGTFELMIQFTGTVHQQMPKPKWLAIHSARISARSARGAREIGTAYPRTPAVIRQTEHPGYLGIELFMPLSHRQLAALEEWRDRGDLDFEIATAGVGGVEGGQTQAEFQTFHSPAPKSAWIAQLKGAGAVDILLLEVPMPLVGASKMERAVQEHLKRAQDHFIEGNYGDCVTECRKATEELEQGTRADWAILATNDTRKAMTKEERERLVLTAIKHYAHQSAHSGAQGGSSDYTRSDARLALVVVTALATH